MRRTARIRLALAIAGSIWLGACSAGSPSPQPAEPARAAEGAKPEEPVTPAQPAEPRVVCLGDSLTAGYGLPSPDEAYPALLERKLADAGYHVSVINAGVSGDTSAGGLRRLDWSLQGDVKVLIVALGGNDALRGLPPSELRDNLEGIVKAAEARHIRVLLMGMEAPPNFGDRYTQDFRAVYRDVAREHHLAFIPFFLNGVAGIDALNQGDGIHPTAQGQQKIADLIWPVLKPLVDATRTS
jgi:acyl-CoA thioesterase-1